MEPLIRVLSPTRPSLLTQSTTSVVLRIQTRTAPQSRRTIRPTSSSCHHHRPHQQEHKPSVPPPTTLPFWRSPSTWRRARLNTLRCLLGCTLGDFSTMWYLQSFHPSLGMASIMGASMAGGIATSLVLETVLLRYGRDGLSWGLAARTAAGMSLISMVAMEAAENVVDYGLTGGVVRLDDPVFWAAAVVSVAAGFAAPLPYNYWRLRRYGRACH